MALILFILSINQLSFLLSKLPGYKVGPPGKRKNSIQFDLIATFTKDINMQFGSDECAYIYIERGKQLSLGRKFSIKNIELNHLENGDCYKYFGQDEDIRFNETLNKERVTK